MGETTMKNRIKKLRIESGLTQMELAEKVGLTQQAISWLELGKREPSFRAVQVIADYFDVPIDYLMGVEHFARKYELWSCSKCRKHFFVTEEPKHCPYCGSTKQLGYGTSKTISF